MEQLDLPLSEPARRAVEDWAKDKGTEAHWLAAARNFFRWGLGREVSELDYDAAIAAVQTIPLH